MCGRTACTLGADEICKACSYEAREKSKGNNDHLLTPVWRDHPGKYHYKPSTNIAPSQFTPVMINTDHLEKAENDVYTIQPMMWGLIPYFHKGDSPKGFGYNTSNCRIEDAQSKPTYSYALKKNQRCVVLCDGFYEWQTTKAGKHKQPYFIFALQDKGVEVWNRKSWMKDDNSGELFDDILGWKGPKLLRMAGLYSKWLSTEGEEIWSYAVVTKAADDDFKKIHSRVPAILNTDEDVNAWLDITVSSDTALLKLHGKPQIKWYQVSDIVNNSRNQHSACNIPLERVKKEKPSCRIMSAWLKSGKKVDDDAVSPVEKRKGENREESGETKKMKVEPGKKEERGYGSP